MSYNNKHTFKGNKKYETVRKKQEVKSLNATLKVVKSLLKAKQKQNADFALMAKRLPK